MYLQLQQQLLEKYGKDLDHIMVGAGQFRLLPAVKSNASIPHLSLKQILLISKLIQILLTSCNYKSPLPSLQS